MPKTVTVEHPDHGELEVELPSGFLPEDEVSENYVPVGAHNAQMAKIRREMKGLADPDELLQDEDFRNRALEAWEINPDAPEDDTPRLTPDRIQAIRDEMVRKEVDPLRKRAEELESTVSTLRKENLHSSIIRAASGKVKESLLQSPVAGATPPIVNMMASYFDFDPETGQWAVREGEGFAYSTEPTEDRPYMGVDEFLAKWSENEANADWVKDTRQRGPGAERKPGGTPTGGAGDVRISYAEAQDAQTYRRARKEAQERGVNLVVTDAPYDQ